MTQPDINDIIIIAKQAGLILREGYEKQHDIKIKTRQDDLVTEMDKKSETFIMDRINTLWPGHTIVTEETGTHTGDSEHAWYIDPCDGTMNYAHGLPLFGVSIGYAYKGELVKGVIYDPMRDECFYAEKGKGAFLNGKPIHVSDQANPSGAIVSTSFVHRTPDISAKIMPQFVALMPEINDFRRTGSAAFDLCCVACGRVDAFFEPKLNLYDIAAGVLIAREAGGRVTGWKNGPDCLVSGDIMATNGLLHDFFMDRMRLY